METITLSIGESKPKKWKLLSSLIMLVEGTDHSHSFVSWRDPDLDVRKVAEAKGSGGQIVTNFMFKKQNKVVRIYQYKVPKEKLKDVEKWIWLHLTPYGFRQIFGIFLMRIMMSLGFRKRAKNPFKDGDYSQICVELSAYAIERSLDIDLPGDVEDYGLIEMQNINKENAKNGLCEIASKELIDRINRKK